MRPQTMYRGGESKKAKITKMEKVYNYFAKVKRRAAEAKKKKETS